MEEENILQDLLKTDMPDAPINSHPDNNLLKTLISNDEFEAALRKKFEFIFNKDVVLSFQDETSKKNKLIDFDIIKIDTLFSTPYDEYTFEKEALFNKMKFILDTKLDRAKGFPDAKRINERIAQQSQFTEQKQIQENQDEPKGFLSRLLKRR